MKKRRTNNRSHWTRLGQSILPSSLSSDEKRRLRNRVLLSALIMLVGWLTFLDSHSLVKRVSWHHEHSELLVENARIEREIERLEHELSHDLSDEAVEEIAREQYGMRRPGETVYRVEQVD